MMLVSLDMASDHLKRDTADDDLDLIAKIKAASKAVMNHIGAGATFTDSNGDVIEDSQGIAIGVEDDIQIATLLLLGEFYKNRGDGASTFTDWQLPPAVKTLLAPYRTPTAV